MAPLPALLTREVGNSIIDSPEKAVLLARALGCEPHQVASHPRLQDIDGLFAAWLDATTQEATVMLQHGTWRCTMPAIACRPPSFSRP